MVLPTKYSLEEYLRMMTEGSKAERLEAVQYFAESPDIVAKDALIAACRDTDLGVRYFAKKALAAIAPDEEIPKFDEDNKDVNEILQRAEGESNTNDTPELGSGDGQEPDLIPPDPDKGEKKKSKKKKSLKSPKKSLKPGQILSGRGGPDGMTLFFAWAFIISLFSSFGFMTFLKIKDWTKGFEVVLGDRIGQIWIGAFILFFMILVFFRKFISPLESAKTLVFCVSLALFIPSLLDMPQDFFGFNWWAMANISIVLTGLLALAFWARTKKALFIIMLILGLWSVYPNIYGALANIDWRDAPRLIQVPFSLPFWLEPGFIGSLIFWPLTLLGALGYVLAGPFLNGARLVGDLVAFPGIFGVTLLMVALNQPGFIENLGNIKKMPPQGVKVLEKLVEATGQKIETGSKLQGSPAEIGNENDEKWGQGLFEDGQDMNGFKSDDLSKGSDNQENELDFGGFDF